MDTRLSPLNSKWWKDAINLFYDVWHRGSSVSFCPSLMAPPQLFGKKFYITKNKITLKYSHTTDFLPIQFFSHNRFKWCTVVPYRHPALHPCLPLHPPVLLCLQALCPAHLQHHYPHMELEYIQILREKKKKIYTMKRVYSKLHCLFIVDIFIDDCQNKKFWSVSAGSTYTVKWYFQTPRNQGVPAPWDSLLIFSIGSRQDFSKELALCKIQQERHWEAIKTEQFKVFLAFFFLFQSRRVTIPLLHMCIRWRLKSHNVSQLFV